MSCPSRRIRKKAIARTLALTAALLSVCALSACNPSGSGASSTHSYDISPIFPLSPGKCAQYGGDQQKSGSGGACLVTKAECERAASDWRRSMTDGGINDAIEFTCR